MTTKLLISVITPTFNRLSELKHLIDSLQRQTISPELFEVIISDDGSNDNTEDYVQERAKEVDFDLRFIKQSNQGPGAARNHGLQEARGDLILFIDSDCEAHPKWAETIFKAFNQEKFDACGGPDGAKADFTPLQKAIDFSMTSFVTTGGIRGHGKHRITKFYPRTHNMGMTAKLYQKVGGFGALRHGQDIELSHRIYKSGAKVAFLKQALVFHRRRTSLARFFKQVFNWGVARINLFRIDSSMLKPIHFLPAIVTTIILIWLILCVMNAQLISISISTGLIILILFGILGGVKKHDWRIIPLVMIVAPIQIIGYGLGFIWASGIYFFSRQEQLTGFVKKYYK